MTLMLWFRDADDGTFTRRSGYGFTGRAARI
jgi:hypothetical protein